MFFLPIMTPDSKGAAETIAMRRASCRERRGSAAGIGGKTPEKLGPVRDRRFVSCELARAGYQRKLRNATSSHVSRLALTKRHTKLQQASLPIHTTAHDASMEVTFEQGPVPVRRAYLPFGQFTGARP
jgi:hypothetical protein